MYVNRAIRKATVLSGKAAWLYHGPWPEEQEDLPYLSEQYQADLPSAFQPMESRRFGLYPIVNRLTWVSQLLRYGVRQLQLRIKDKEGSELEAEIRQSLALARQYQARLFINDHWELALHYGAYGVHLGQDDFQRTDFRKLRQASLRLGVSTHGYYEMARAHALRPSYLAFGPIYPTTSKPVPIRPQGLAKLKCWRRTLKYPLVAIGGINPSRVPEVLSSGVDGIALISAITQAEDPERATQDLFALVERHGLHIE
jgi:hydroxymethylpyrimidine kinase/phosphomethylpyrimidine kinase/thiamine-phosphate diphosphorylase